MGFPKGIQKLLGVGATITAPTGPTTTVTVAGGSAITSLTGDVTGTGPGATATTVVNVNGVAVSANAATIAAQGANAQTRNATGTLNAGEETVFTGSTAAQTLTLPVTPTVSSVNTITNLASVSVTVAAGAGNTINTYGTVGSVTLAAGQAVYMVFIGTVWYVQLTQGLDFPSGGVLATTKEQLLSTTGSTSVCTYTPGAAGNFEIGLYFRVITATTNVTITVTWTDVTGAQTLTVLNVVSEVTGSYALTKFMIDATAAAITVSFTAGTANQVYASASIVQN